MAIPWARARITHPSRKGQLTIPRALIRELKLVPGNTRLPIMREGTAIFLVPVMGTGEGEEVSDG